MTAVGCVLGLVAQVARGAAPGETADSAHVLVLAAEALAERPLPEASAVAVRVALATPGLSVADRNRVALVKAKLRVKEPGPASSAAPPGESQAGALLRLVDELYKELQFDGATAALQLAGRCEPISKAEQAQLSLRRGLLAMEAFDEAGARREFQKALGQERTALLPRFAPPKTLRLLEEVRTALPPTEIVHGAPVPQPAPAGLASLRPWAWVPAAGGAVLGAAGGLCYLGAKANHDRLAGFDPAVVSAEEVHATAEAGRALQTGAFVLLGAGGLALASAAALVLMDDPKAVQASVQVGPGPGGAPGVVIVGVFP